MKNLVVLAATALLACHAWAQTTATEAWVRATAPQQMATGLYLTLTSTPGGRLVSASSPVAGLVEIHEMRMDGNIMRMRAVDALELPPGQAVALKPGGYHVMLMALKQQLKPGDTVPVTLVVEGANKQRQNVDVKATVRAASAAPGGPAPSQGSGHGGHGSHKH
jgi:periplasmic copper chaperone A